MGEAESKAKKRVLPHWMREDEANVKKQCTKDVKRKKAASAKKCILYCMNEKELVDYALEIVNKGKKDEEIREEAEADTEYNEKEECRGTEEKPKTPLPEASHASQLTPPLSKEMAKDTAQAGGVSDEEDDPLKYVREIFFS
ncbi:cell cycle regulator of non-homologous end joining [Hyperolius riggenbachi]|uniref:cell cycle regulator of non-homologous end joining n=1 Tax=Hyperolius riggenbachi TaxID=752182 RepID=UPI0035A30480